MHAQYRGFATADFYCYSSEKFLEYNLLKDALDTSWVKHQKPKSLKKISNVFFIFQGNVHKMANNLALEVQFPLIILL